MNTKRTLKWGLVTAAATCAVVAAMPGCELLVDFDRSKIPSGDGGGTEDGTMPPSEGGGMEAATEAGEAASDAPSEAAEASTSDAPMDAPPETTPSEGGTDGPSEAAPEGGTEAGPEGGDASDGAMGTPIFAITPVSVSFGTVATGGMTAGYAFTVTNSGTVAGTPTITPGGTNPGDFAATGCTSAVAPSGTCTLSVTFSPPSGATGARAATISVGTGTPAAVSGTAATSGTLTLIPAIESFGTISAGSSSSEFALTVTNTDTVNAVTIGTPTVDGQDSTMFVLDADGGASQCAGGTLPPNGSCTLFMHFAPTAVTGTGPRYASLSINATATDGGTAPGTASASLTGTGQ